MKVAFVVPVNGISGGLYVVYQHAHFLKGQGYEVEVLMVSTRMGLEVTCFPQFSLPVRSFREAVESGISYDVVFGTWWETAYDLFFLKSKNYLFFCQSDERRFYSNPLDPSVHLIERLYQSPALEVITEARWIRTLFKEEFNKEIEYAPNGIDLDLFHPQVIPIEPRPSQKVRVLIEGPGSQAFKRVDLAFRVVENIPGLEVWLVSSDGVTQGNWKYDRIFTQVKLQDMPKIYASCDVLLKLSTVEGFFGPPLEMMACGGTAVVSNVTGYDEYIVHEKNALVVPKDDLQAARASLIRLVNDGGLRKSLSQAGLETAKSLSWKQQMPKFHQAMLNCIKKQGRLGAEAVSSARREGYLYQLKKRDDSHQEQLELLQRQLDEIKNWRPYRVWKGLRKKVLQKEM